MLQWLDTGGPVTSLTLFPARLDADLLITTGTSQWPAGWYPVNLQRGFIAGPRQHEIETRRRILQHSEHQVSTEKESPLTPEPGSSIAWTLDAWDGAEGVSCSRQLWMWSNKQWKKFKQKSSRPWGKIKGWNKNWMENLELKTAKWNEIKLKYNTQWIWWNSEAGALMIEVTRCG